jgi:hypothetical protein
MKAFLFRYIDNLLDWGDSLFQMDTREAINEAMIAYMRCFAILGQRPYVIPEHGEFELQIHTANKMLPKKNDLPLGKKIHTATKMLPTKNDLPPGKYLPPEKENTGFFLPGWKNRSFVQQKLAKSLSNWDLTDSLENPAMLGKFFCVPENKQLMTYWDRVDDRLDKIRRSLNFSGTFRQLALFQPPIDPRALIAAGGAAGVLSTLPVPHYRYSYLVEIAKEMIQTTIAFGGQLLAAFEAKDAEELAALEIDMSIALNIVDQSIQELAVMAAEHEIEQVNVSKDSLVAKITFNATVLGGDYDYSEDQKLLDAEARRAANANSAQAALLGKIRFTSELVGLSRCSSLSFSFYLFPCLPLILCTFSYVSSIVEKGHSLSATVDARSSLIINGDTAKAKEVEAGAREVEAGAREANKAMMKAEEKRGKAEKKAEKKKVKDQKKADARRPKPTHKRRTGMGQQDWDDAKKKGAAKKKISASHNKSQVKAAVNSGKLQKSSAGSSAAAALARAFPEVDTGTSGLGKCCSTVCGRTFWSHVTL